MNKAGPKSGRKMKKEETMAITLEQAKKLEVGQVLHHAINKNADGTPQRWRVNGKVKTWKRDEKRVRVPVKNGLKNCDYLTEESLHLVSLSGDL